MKRLVSGLLAISLIICFSVTVSAENRSFNDLSKSHWAYNDIMRLVKTETSWSNENSKWK